MLPWSPLGGGKLTRPWGQTGSQRAQTDRWGKEMYNSDASKPVVDALEAVAKAKGKPMAQVAMAWLLAKPGVTSPIVGVSKMSHLDDAIAAVDLKLGAEEIAQLEAPYKPLVVTGF